MGECATHHGGRTVTATLRVGRGRKEDLAGVPAGAPLLLTPSFAVNSDGNGL